LPVSPHVDENIEAILPFPPLATRSVSPPLDEPVRPFLDELTAPEMIIFRQLAPPSSQTPFGSKCGLQTRLGRCTTNCFRRG
jgi:hypothetical protein